MTEIVGILNVTPDSFSDGGAWNNPEIIRDRIDTLFLEGAHMIDVGAESTRPGAQAVHPEDEWRRLVPILSILRKYPANKFSVDTRHALVADYVLSEWSNEVTINDVTGLHDLTMVEIIAEHEADVIVGHLPIEAHGDIAKAHTIKETSLEKVVDEIHAKIARLVALGIQKNKIIVDPGIGFGKHPDLNQKLVSFARFTDYPTMIGYSRKRFLGPQRLEPEYNAEIGKLAASWGARYLRVHDVAAHVARLQSRYYRPL